MQNSLPMEFEEVGVKLGSHFEFMLPKQETGEHTVFLHITYQDFDEKHLHCLAWALIDFAPKMHCVWGGKVEKPKKNDIQSIVNAVTWVINNDEAFYDALDDALAEYEGER